MLHRLVAPVGIILCLTACLPVFSIPQPTQTPLPVAPDPTSSATPSPFLTPTPRVAQAPTQTPSPTDRALPDTSPTPFLAQTQTVLPIPTLEPPSTLVMTEVPQPAADSGMIQFFSPGPLSKVTSPIKAYGYSAPGYNNRGELDLYGEDGRLLASQILALYAEFRWAAFYWEMPFETTSVGELGRISLTLKDEYGRLLAVNSVHLLLLTQGMTVLTPPDDPRERCVIDQPAVGQKIAGGSLSVTGKMRPFNNLPLSLQLVARDGSILGVDQVPIAPAPDGSYVPFQAAIPYNIPIGEYARLTVRQFDDRISGIMYLYSQEIFLNP